MALPPKLRLGISMRTTEALDYDEKRDSIARDWSVFLLKEFPAVEWIYLPNIGKSIGQYCKQWNINGFILSGGEDLGTDKERDTTEKEILEYALHFNLPLLGICRGLQLIYQYYGGVIKDGPQEFQEAHCATSHYVFYGQTKVLVNSYHKRKLSSDSLPHNLKVEAKCESDKSIEAVSGENLLGIMWHPERELAYNAWNVHLIKKFFRII